MKVEASKKKVKSKRQTERQKEKLVEKKERRNEDNKILKEKKERKKETKYLSNEQMKKEREKDSYIVKWSETDVDKGKRNTKEGERDEKKRVGESKIEKDKERK